MKDTPSRTPSLLIENQQAQTDILDDIAAVAPRVPLIKDNRHPKLFGIVALLIIIVLAFLLIGKMTNWQDGPKKINTSESMLFLAASDFQYQDNTEKSAATISPALLASGNHDNDTVKKTRVPTVKKVVSGSSNIRKEIEQVSLINISALEQAMLPHAEEGLLTELIGFVRKNNYRPSSISNSINAAQYKDIKQLDACPAANTEEGMLCRQQVCLNNSDTAECAKSSSDS